MTIPCRLCPNLQPIKVGLLGVISGVTGLALWNHVSVVTTTTVTPAEIYPASIPWLQDQQTCEKTHRFWENEQCWDNQHDSTF